MNDDVARTGTAISGTGAFVAWAAPYMSTLQIVGIAVAVVSGALAGIYHLLGIIQRLRGFRGGV